MSDSFQHDSLRDYCSVAKLCPTLCNPMDCSTPGFPVLHYLPGLRKLMSIVEKSMAPHPSALAWTVLRGQRNLVDCSPWGPKESDMTERLHFHFSLSCIGEGNGNALQCSCLENPRDSGAWWAAVFGVAHSRTRLKRLSSSSSSSSMSVERAMPSILILSPLSPLVLNLSQHNCLFLMSWLFALGGQSIGASASASILAMNIQG